MSLVNAAARRCARFEDRSLLAIIAASVLCGGGRGNEVAKVSELIAVVAALASVWLDGCGAQQRQHGHSSYEPAVGGAWSSRRCSILAPPLRAPPNVNVTWTCTFTTTTTTIGANNTTSSTTSAAAPCTADTGVLTNIQPTTVTYTAPSKNHDAASTCHYHHLLLRRSPLPPPLSQDTKKTAHLRYHSRFRHLRHHQSGHRGDPHQPEISVRRHLDQRYHSQRCHLAAYAGTSLHHHSGRSRSLAVQAAAASVLTASTPRRPRVPTRNYSFHHYRRYDSSNLTVIACLESSIPPE